MASRRVRRLLNFRYPGLVLVGNIGKWVLLSSPIRQLAVVRQHRTVVVEGGSASTSIFDEGPHRGDMRE